MLNDFLTDHGMFFNVWQINARVIDGIAKYLNINIPFDPLERMIYAQWLEVPI